MGIENFEGRSSLRTWLLAVMINIAKARGARETPEGSVLGNELVEIARRELENLPEQTSASPTNGIQPIDCNELVELVTAYRDGSLDLETPARFAPWARSATKS